MNVNVEALNMALARNCLTWKELSTLSGISTVTLARINNGSQDAQPVTVGKIAKALDVPVEQIIKSE